MSDAVILGDVRERDAEIERLQGEVERLDRESDVLAGLVGKADAERDVALQRAEAAERDRDEWRRVSNAMEFARDSAESRCQRLEVEVVRIRDALSALCNEVVADGPWGCDADGNDDGSIAEVCILCEGTSDGSLHKPTCEVLSAMALLDEEDSSDGG